jgi:hypothetical protein
LLSQFGRSDPVSLKIPDLIRPCRGSCQGMRRECRALAEDLRNGLRRLGREMRLRGIGNRFMAETLPGSGLLGPGEHRYDPQEKQPHRSFLPPLHGMKKPIPSHGSNQGHPALLRQRKRNTVENRKSVC